MCEVFYYICVSEALLDIYLITQFLNECFSVFVIILPSYKKVRNKLRQKANQEGFCYHCGCIFTVHLISSFLAPSCRHACLIDGQLTQFNNPPVPNPYLSSDKVYNQMSDLIDSFIGKVVTK